MTFSRQKIIAAMKEAAVILGFLLVVILVALFEQLLRKDYSKDVAYVYVPSEMTPRFRYTDIKMFDCAWCHRTNSLSRHHIIPQAADPSLRHVATNIVVLCRDCHFVLGHRCNTHTFNPDVMEIINTYTNCIRSEDYYKEHHR